MSPVTTRRTFTRADAWDGTRAEDSRRCSGRVDRAIRAARTARIALQRAGS